MLIIHDFTLVCKKQAIFKKQTKRKLNFSFKDLYKKISLIRGAKFYGRERFL